MLVHRTYHYVDPIALLFDGLHMLFSEVHIRYLIKRTFIWSNDVIDPIQLLIYDYYCYLIKKKDRPPWTRSCSLLCWS